MPLNFFCKFANDLTTLIPGSYNFHAHVEIQHLRDWVEVNKLMLNYKKIKEIVLYPSEDLLKCLPASVVLNTLET